MSRKNGNGSAINRQAAPTRMLTNPIKTIKLKKYKKFMASNIKTLIEGKTRQI